MNFILALLFSLLGLGPINDEQALRQAPTQQIQPGLSGDATLREVGPIVEKNRINIGPIIVIEDTHYKSK